MIKQRKEHVLQTYLIKNNGQNLKKIDSNLNILESEHKFRSGRIDILAEKKNDLQKQIIGIELKSSTYQTRAICAQLLNYLNYLDSKNGAVYFVAPKIKYGIYSTLKTFYDFGKLRLFEFEQKSNDYFFRELFPNTINDRLQIQIEHTDINYSNTEIINTEKIKKGISILIKDKKQAKLLDSIIDTQKSKHQQLEAITDSLIDLIPSKNYSFIKTAYELLKLF
ncbi:MAG: hypothetical protein WC758_06280 [Candidatus Woesearchaeota archaeon]|jgi:hypothetical protein